MDSSSSSSSTKKKTELSLRKQTCFKKSSHSSNNITAAKKTTNLSLREQTMFKKAYELATLCDIDVCVIYYDCDGELIKTWPEDKSKVRDMAESFTKLNEKERRKKSNNLSQVLYKKLLNDKKKSLDNKDNKFSEKLSEMENSLENRLRIFQAKLLRLIHTEPNQCRAVSSGLITTNLSPSSSQIEDPHQPLNLKSDEYRYEKYLSHTGGFTTDLSPSSLIDDPHQKLTKSLRSGVSSTEQDLSMSSLLNQPQSKFSFFLYNHDNGSFCQFPESVSSFNQVTTPYNNLSTALLGEQGIGLRSSINNNIDLPMVFPPQMQTQNPLLQFDQFAAWNQPSFADQMIFSS